MAGIFPDSDINLLKNNVLLWLDAQSMDGISYRLSNYAKPTVLSTCFAILTHELFDNIKELDTKQIDSWKNYFHKNQDPSTGMFIDPSFNKKDLLWRVIDEDYFRMQIHYFVLHTLLALNAPPESQWKFMEPYHDSTFLLNWLKQLDWLDPWTQSNRVMFIGTFLLYEAEYFLQQQSLDHLHVMLDWLDTKQDSETGLWGPNEGVSLDRSMAAAYHFYPLYLYCQRKINYIYEAIDSTLSLQAEDGLYEEALGGNSCKDLDAIDILIKLSCLTDHRAEEIKYSLLCSLNALLNNQNRDGGFCWQKTLLPPKSLKRRVGELFFLDKLLNKEFPPKIFMHYSGWKMMPHEVRTSDLWSCWFRPLAIALIDEKLKIFQRKEFTWNFRNFPVLGWHF